MKNFTLVPFTQTQMNLAEKCSLSWFYYRKKVPRVVSDDRYTLAGSIVHESIKDYYKVITDNPHSGVISGTFKEILERRWDPYKEKLKDLYNRKEKCKESFIKFEVGRLGRWQKFRPTLIEDKREAKLDGIDFFTILDTFWKEDGILVDWKTGNKVMIDTSDYIQGSIEKLILEDNGFTVRKVLFIMLSSGKVIEMPHKPREFILDRARAMIEIWKEQRYERNKEGGCMFCNYQLRCQLEEKGICMWEI